jgi:5'-nucleotidase
VLYSGTVAAAIEGAFFEITSVAVSLEYDAHADYDKAASLALRVIRTVLDQKDPAPHLYNLNIPSEALENPAPQVRVVPMAVARYGETYDKRIDPRGRSYYWATDDPPPRRSAHETDLTALADGHVTLTPLGFDLTHGGLMGEMRKWQFELNDE